MSLPIASENARHCPNGCPHPPNEPMRRRVNLPTVSEEWTGLSEIKRSSPAEK